MASNSRADLSASRFAVLEQGTCVPVTISLMNEVKLQRTCNVNAPLRLLFDWAVSRIRHRNTEGDARQDEASLHMRKSQPALLVLEKLDEFDFFGLAVAHKDDTQSHTYEWHFLDLERSLSKQDHTMLPSNWSALQAASKRSGTHSATASVTSRANQDFNDVTFPNTNGNVPRGVERTAFTFPDTEDSLRLYFRVQFYPNALLFDSVFKSPTAIDTLYLQLRRDSLDLPVVTEFDSEVASSRYAADSSRHSRYEESDGGDAALYETYDSVSQRDTVRRLVLLAAYAILIEHRRCCASRIVQSVYRGLQSSAAEREFDSPDRANRARSRDASKSRRSAPFRKYFHSLLTQGHVRLDEFMSIEAIKLTRHIDALISLMHSAVERVLSRIQNAAQPVQDSLRVPQIDEAMAARMKMAYCGESQRLAAFGMHLFRTRESLLGVSLSGLAVLTRNYLLVPQYQRGGQSGASLGGYSAIEFDADRHLVIQNRFRWNEIAAVRFRHDRFTVQLRSRRTQTLDDAQAAQQFDPRWPNSQPVDSAASSHKTKLRLESSRKCALLLRFCNEQLHFYRQVIEKIKRAQERDAKLNRIKQASANTNNNRDGPSVRNVPAGSTVTATNGTSNAHGAPPPPPIPTGGVPYNMQTSQTDGSVTFEIALLIQNASAYLLLRDGMGNGGGTKPSVNIARLGDAELNRLFARTLGFTVTKTPDTLRAALRRVDPHSAATCQVEHVVEHANPAGASSAIRRGDLLLRVNDVNVRYFAVRYVLNVIVDECVAEAARSRDEPSVIRFKMKRIRSFDAVQPNLNVNANANANVNWTTSGDWRSARERDPPARDDHANVNGSATANFRVVAKTGDDSQYSYSRPRDAHQQTVSYNDRYSMAPFELADVLDKPTASWAPNGYQPATSGAHGAYRSANAVGYGQPMVDGEATFALQLQAPPPGRITPHHRSTRVPDDRYKMSRSQPQLSNAERPLGAPFNTPQTHAHNAAHAHAQLNPNARAWNDAIGESRSRERERDTQAQAQAQAQLAPQYAYSRPATAAALSRQHSAVPFAYAYNRPQQFSDADFQVARFRQTDHDSEIL